MKIAASMSVGRLAPKHSLDIDGIRAISPMGLFLRNGTKYTIKRKEFEEYLNDAYTI